MSANRDLSSFAARLRDVIPAATLRSDEFKELALELFALQFRHNTPYRRFCELRGSTPDAIVNWPDIPAVPTLAFKELEFTALPPTERIAVFHSSGTTAQRPSRHYHNADSLALYELSAWQWFAAHVPVSDPGNLVILTPPPAQVPHSSLVHMFGLIREKMARPESAFVGKATNDGSWTLDLDAAIATLRNTERDGRSVGVLGTAFSFVQLLDHLSERGVAFQMPAGSWALETGGYKGRSRALPREELHTVLSGQLGISRRRILCEYGMSELSSQAYDRSLGHGDGDADTKRFFQFPAWARVRVTSPETGAEVAEGETGLVRIFDLANVYSVMALQTEDFAVRRGNGFELIGRAPAAEPRGCSLMTVAPSERQMPE